jgi:cysteine synthase
MDGGSSLLELGSPCELPFPPVFADLSNLVDGRFRLLAKLEFFNPAGSIKMKPAVGLVQALARGGRLKPDSILVDTSSGNMGIALSMVARSLKLAFVCVTDEKITPHNRRLMEAYGAQVHVMPRSTHRERCDHIRAQESADPRYVWTRQFQDVRNPETHELTTAQEIFGVHPHPDAIFIGVGTGGTLAGCAQVRDRVSPMTRIVAVDPVGSRHFDPDPPPVVRRIPGIGATERSPFLDLSEVDDVVSVNDAETLAACLNVLQQTGWLLGGSSGSILHAVLRRRDTLPGGGLVIAVCADSGERYLDTLYSADWRKQWGFAAGDVDPQLAVELAGPAA